MIYDDFTAKDGEGYIMSSNNPPLQPFEDSSDYTNNWLATLSSLPSLIYSTESTINSPAYSEINISPITTLSSLSIDNQDQPIDQAFPDTYNFQELNLNFSIPVKDCLPVQEGIIGDQSLGDLADMIILPNESNNDVEIEQGNLLGLLDSCITAERNQDSRIKRSGEGLTSEKMYMHMLSSRQDWNMQSTFSTNSTNMHPFDLSDYHQNDLVNLGSNQLFQLQSCTKVSEETNTPPHKVERIEKRRRSKTLEDVIEYFSNIQPEQGSFINNRQRRSDSFHTSNAAYPISQRFMKRHRSHTDASALYTRQSIGSFSCLPTIPNNNQSDDQFIQDMIGQVASKALKRERSDSFASSVVDQQDKITVRDEQNRQKSKRYYERKKAQNVATTALCTALDSWQAIFSTSSQIIELPEVNDTVESVPPSPSSPSQRKKLYKIAQRNEETRQIRTIMSSAKRLEGLLKSASSSEIAKIVILHRQFAQKRDKSTIEMYDHLSTLEAGLCIWLDHLHLWSDLVLAEKRLADTHTGKPVQRLISLLSNIS